jgi:hypothetical protein
MLRFNMTYVQRNLIYLALARGSSSDTFVLEVLFLISEIRTRPIIKGLRGSKILAHYQQYPAPLEGPLARSLPTFIQTPCK